MSFSTHILTFLVLHSAICPIYATVSGTITVSNKLTRRHVATIHALLTSSEPLEKAQLALPQPLDACMPLNAPLNTDLYSVHGPIPRISSVILTHDSDCDINQKTTNAQDAGFSGIIIYSKQSVSSQAQLQWQEAINFQVASVTFNDGLTLLNYMKSPYVIHIERDRTLLEMCQDAILAISLPVLEQIKVYSEYIVIHMKGLGDAFLSLPPIVELLIQVILLTSPLTFLLIVIQSTRHRYYPDTRRSYSYYSYTTYNEETWNNNTYDETSMAEDEVRIQPYRKLLGVPRGATRAQIEAEFRRKSASYHPDKNGHLSEEERLLKTERFKEYSAAKTALLEEVDGHLS